MLSYYKDCRQILVFAFSYNHRILNQHATNRYLMLIKDKPMPCLLLCNLFDHTQSYRHLIIIYKYLHILSKKTTFYQQTSVVLESVIIYSDLDHRIFLTFVRYYLISFKLTNVSNLIMYKNLTFYCYFFEVISIKYAICFMNDMGGHINSFRLSLNHLVQLLHNYKIHN